jgi:septal ring factor EnvC (AmiA/AmiB activator)
MIEGLEETIAVQNITQSSSTMGDNTEGDVTSAVIQTWGMHMSVMTKMMEKMMKCVETMVQQVGSMNQYTKSIDQHVKSMDQCVESMSGLQEQVQSLADTVESLTGMITSLWRTVESFNAKVTTLETQNEALLEVVRKTATEQVKVTQSWANVAARGPECQHHQSCRFHHRPHFHLSAVALCTRIAPSHRIQTYRDPPLSWIYHELRPK